VRRKQGWCGADRSEEGDEGDEGDDRKVGEQRHAVEEVIENLGLKQPTIFDVYNHGKKGGVHRSENAR